MSGRCERVVLCCHSNFARTDGGKDTVPMSQIFNYAVLQSLVALTGNGWILYRWFRLFFLFWKILQKGPSQFLASSGFYIQNLMLRIP